MSTRKNVLSTNNAKYAVVLHFFYIDLWEEIKIYLQNIPTTFDLFVTIPQDKFNEVNHIILADYPNATLFPVLNQGRDIAPFFHVFNHIDMSIYTAVCKLHSKKSVHLSNGYYWRNDLYQKLLGSSAKIADIFKAFEVNPLIGMIAPDEHIIPFSKFMSVNKKNIDSLLTRISLKIEDISPYFVAGGMFWIRPQSMTALLKLHLKTSDFEPETGQLDGSMAHAMERLFFSLVKYDGYWIANTSLVDRLMTSPLSHQALSNLLGQQNEYVSSKYYPFVGGAPFKWEKDHFDNGTPIKDIYKNIYNERPDLKQAYPNPYEVGDKKSFLFWIYSCGVKEYQELKDVQQDITFYFDNGILFNKLCCDIYETRMDLQKAYPQPFKTTFNESFFSWLMTQGPHEYPELISFRESITLYFDNQQLFSNQCWNIYLSRPDLQKKYPNPFSCPENNSFYWWLSTQGMIEYPELQMSFKKQLQASA